MLRYKTIELSAPKILMGHHLRGKSRLGAAHYPLPIHSNRKQLTPQLDGIRRGAQEF